MPAQQINNEIHFGWMFIINLIVYFFSFYRIIFVCFYFLSLSLSISLCDIDFELCIDNRQKSNIEYHMMYLSWSI